MHRAWLAWVGLFVVLSIRAEAQAVTAVEGSIVTFTAPAPIEGSPGDLAKLCSDQVIAGKSTRVCSAMLRIKTLVGTRGTGELVKGNSSAVQIGMSVVIDRRSPPASASGKGKRVNPDDPADQLRAGEEALAAERWSEAVAHYERLLVLVPADPYAERRLQEAREGEKQAALRAEIRARRQKEATKVAYLESSLDRSIASGDSEAAGAYARMLLEIDPFEPKALGVRDRARGVVEEDANRLAERWDWAGFQAAWARYAEVWSDPSAQERASVEARDRIEEVFSGWTGKTCREFPQVFAALREGLRREGQFLAAAEAQLKALGCPVLVSLAVPEVAAGSSPASLSAVVARSGGGPVSSLMVNIAATVAGGEKGGGVEVELVGAAPSVVLVPGGVAVRVSAHDGKEEREKSDQRDSWQGTPPSGGEVTLCVDSTSNPLKKAMGRRFRVQVCPGS